MHIYTSESVSEGHPDKLADQISDALLDAFLEQDKDSRVAIETLLTRGLAVVAGEVSSTAYVDVAHVVRKTVSDVGYTHTDLGFDGNTCGVLVAIQEQSLDIAVGVDHGGAGDQGMMFGLATRETPEFMPLPIAIAHAITRRAASVRRKHPELGLRPDVKSQVSVEYDAFGHPKRINTVVVSAQHEPKLNQQGVQEIVRSYILNDVYEEYSKYIDGAPTLHVNPTGQFVIGGPQGDTGVTGRKIIVDTYGGLCPHGGGAFSGKDPSKVDRSAAYMARYVAKNIVAAELATKAQVQVAYAIGVEEPVAIDVETFGTGNTDSDEIIKRVKESFDLKPRSIIETLGLLTTTYLPTAKNGHFGNPNFPWESTAAAALLKTNLTEV